MQLEAMFDHKQDLLFNDFQSIVLTVEIDRIDDSHNSSSRPDFVNYQALLKVKHVLTTRYLQSRLDQNG